MPRSDKIALTSCNIAAMEGIRKCDFRTTGLFSRSSFQIHIILALSFWISHVLSVVPVSNFPTPRPQTNAPAPAPLSDSPPPAYIIHPPPPPAPPAPPLAIPPALDTFTPPSPSVVQEAATNNSWNDSEKAGVIIASIGALLQVFVVAYLLVKRHQMLAMVQDCKQASELMDLVRIIKKGRWACQQGQFHTILWIMSGLLHNPLFDSRCNCILDSNISQQEIFLSVPIKATSQVSGLTEISVFCF